jgi:HEAT repeat protein
VPCVVEFLTSEDWAVRKAAAEALGKMAMAERNLVAKYKVSCLNSLESRRFDKVNEECVSACVRRRNPHGYFGNFIV